MKKIYTAPHVHTVNIKAEQPIAASLEINNTEVSNTTGLARDRDDFAEDQSWGDMWE